MATIDTEITEGVRDILADHFSIEKATITDESRFVDDLRADSFDMVEIVFQIEDAFDIVVPYKIANDFATVGDAVAFVRAQCSPSGATQGKTDGSGFFGVT
jgi:acyl carrier protein